MVGRGGRGEEREEGVEEGGGGRGGRRGLGHSFLYDVCMTQTLIEVINNLKSFLMEEETLPYVEYRKLITLTSSFHPSTLQLFVPVVDSLSPSPLPRE